MKIPVYICAMLLVLSAPPKIFADDRADVLHVISTLFKAMEHRDVELTKSVLMPAGELVNASGLAGLSSKGTKFRTYISGLEKGGELLQERLINPQVKIRGDIAMIWSEYQFFVDGKMSHCGVDNFSLLKVNKEWRLMYSTYTVERSPKCVEMFKNEWVEAQYIVHK